MAKNKFKWLVEIEIDKIWIEDGFELDNFSLKEAIEEYSLGYAFDNEVKVKILKAPSALMIAKAQGYKDIKHKKKVA